MEQLFAVEINLPNISKPNLTILIAFIAIGFGEWLNLPTLRLIAIHLAIPACIIQVIVLIAYTVNYCIDIHKNNHNNQK